MRLRSRTGRPTERRGKGLWSRTTQEGTSPAWSVSTCCIESARRPAGRTVSIAPTWGQAGSTAERLWSAHDTGALGTDSEFKPESRLEFDAGYGFGLAHGRGVLTPYAGMTLGDGGNRTVRTGARWQVGPDTVVGVEATRQTSGAEETANEVRLRAAIRF